MSSLASELLQDLRFGSLTLLQDKYPAHDLGRCVNAIFEECIPAFRGPPDAHSRSTLQQLLAFFFEQQTRVPAASEVNLTTETNPLCEAVRATIEDAFVAAESSCAAIWLNVHGYSQRAADSLDSLLSIIEAHPASKHWVYEQLLPHRCDTNAFRFFLWQEATVDASTDDFLAQLQVGAPLIPKMEMARNYWDEMGEGNAELAHRVLFEQATLAICGGDSNPVPVHFLALECGNLQNALACRRSRYYLALGYFFALESLAPKRFRSLLRGWDRLMLGHVGRAYHEVHTHIDEEHSRRWVSCALRPTLEAQPDAWWQIALGLVMRLESSMRYLDAIGKMTAREPA